MAEAKKQQTQKSQRTGELKGSPEVTRKKINPKGSDGTTKTVSKEASSTPFDRIAMYFVLGREALMATSVAAGAWFLWYEDWPSIAHLYWPLFFSSIGTIGLVYYRFNRE